MIKVALLVIVKAKPGKEDEVAELLSSALPLAQEEAGTVHWFALKINSSTFGVFDTFPDDAARKAHLAGKIATALMANTPTLLAGSPQIEFVDVLAAK